MFTGIVESGEVVGLKKLSEGLELVILTPWNNSVLKTGESISVNGTCLSLTKKSGKKLSFFVSPETIQKTNISTLKKGQAINIEHPLTPGSYLGGHFVQGHVDTVSAVKKVTKNKDVWIVEISLPKQFKQYVVYKGSIAVNGVSLTINKVNSKSFELCIIPITLKKSNFSYVTKNSMVNLEFDILAKYTERLLKKKK